MAKYKRDWCELVQDLCSIGERMEAEQVKLIKMNTLTTGVTPECIYILCPQQFLSPGARHSHLEIDGREPGNTVIGGLACQLSVPSVVGLFIQPLSSGVNQAPLIWYQTRLTIFRDLFENKRC